MSQRPQEHFRRGLPTAHGRVRRVLDYEAGEGTSRQQHPPSPPRIQRPWSRSRYPPTVDDIIATPRKHRGVLRGIRHRQKLPGTKRYVRLGVTRGGLAMRIFRQPRTVGTNMCHQVVEESEKATSSSVDLVPWRKMRRSIIVLV